MADRKELLKGLAGGRVENRGQLDQDIFRVKGDQSAADMTEPRTRMNVGTERIDTKNVGKVTEGADFKQRAKELDLKQQLKSTFADAAKRGDEDMMRKLRTIAGKLGTAAKALPAVGAIAAGLGSQDASAGIPILGAADPLGQGSDAPEGFDIADPAQDEERMKAMARKMALQQMRMGR